MSTDNEATIERIRGIYESGDTPEIARAADELLADGFVQEWPQSGERLSRTAFVTVNERYEEATGTKPDLKLRRVVGGGDVYVIEGTIDYGDGVPVSYVGIMELRDGKVTKLTDYFASPFEAPAWRADVVDRMEPIAT